MKLSEEKMSAREEATGRRESWSLLHGRGWALALGVSIALLFWWGGYAQFFNPDEGRYASASLEMAGGLAGSPSDWVVPHLNGVPRLNKPPLVYWLGALSFSILGPSEAAGRLPGMLAGAGVALALWFWGRRAVGETTGRLAALVWLSATFPFAFARIANTDILLSAAIALSTLGVWLAIDGGAPDWELPTSRDVWLGALLAGIGMALGILAKGPVGVFFPLATGFVSILATVRWRVLGDWRTWAALGGALALAIGIVLPWALAISARVPGVLARFFFEENLGRFSGGVSFHDAKPWYFFLPIMFAGMLPWSAFALAWAPTSSERERRAVRFWAVWAILIVGIFSMSSTKLVSYVLPAFAPLCLLVAFAFARRIEATEEATESEDKLGEVGRTSSTWGRSWGWWTASVWLTVVLHVALLAGAAYYMASEKGIPRPLGMQMLGLLCVGPIVVIAGIARSRMRAAQVFGWVWAGAAVVHVALLATARQVATYEDTGAMVRTLSGFLEPGDRMVMMREFQPTAIFYLRRPVFIMDFKNTSGLDADALEDSKHFVRFDERQLDLWRLDAARTFLICRWNSPGIEHLKKSNWRLIGRTNQHRLFSNRAAPAGFRFDRVTPAKDGR